MPDAFVTTTELADRNDWPAVTPPEDPQFTAYETDRTLQAIWAATSMIQADTGQRFVTVANETITLEGGYDRNVLWLPQRPVTAVGAVTTTAYGATTARTLGVDYAVSGAKITWLLGWGWPAAVTVTYSHGYAPSVTGDTPQAFPEQIKWVCNTAATRLLDNPSSLRSETVGSVSQTFGGAAADLGPGLTQAEKDALNPYKSLVLA